MNETLQQLSKNQFRSENIFFIEAPSVDELFWLYENCLLFLFPSTYEGFGLPILEAAYFKKHQIISKIEIFQEIGRWIDGVTYIENPMNPIEWKDAILFYSNKKHQKKIKNQNLRFFDYKNSAKKMVEILQKYER
jgi:glycosyltransferase involved in cell wall biosynthesis